MYQYSRVPIQYHHHKLSRKYTFDEAIEHIGFGRFQVKVLFILGFFWIAETSELLVLSIVPLSLQCEWKIDQTQIALLTSSVFAGMAISSTVIGWICDQYGRKRGILLLMIFGMAMSILSSFSPHYQWFVLLRFLVGVSLGATVQIYGYASEFIPSKQRRYVILSTLFWPVGGVISSLIGITTLYGLSWRWYIVVMCMPPFIGIILLFQLPESCRYLLIAGKLDESKEVLSLAALMNTKQLPKGELVLKTGNIHSSSKKKAEKEITNRGDVLKLFSKEHWKTTLLLCLMQFSFGLSYFGTVLLITNYFSAAEKTCTSNKLSTKSLNLQTFTTCSYCHHLNLRDYLDLAWTSFAEAPSYIATFFLIELIGRKSTLFIECLIVFISMLILLFCTTWYVQISLLFIARGVSGSATIALQQYTPEVYPTYLRGIGVGFVSLWYRCGGMVTPFLAQVAIYKSLKGTLLCYMVFLLLSMTASLLLPIETRGRPLEDSDN